jgi:hypothetical protein
MLAGAVIGHHHRVSPDRDGPAGVTRIENPLHRER